MQHQNLAVDRAVCVYLFGKFGGRNRVLYSKPAPCRGSLLCVPARRRKCLRKLL